VFAFFEKLVDLSSGDVVLLTHAGTIDMEKVLSLWDVPSDVLELGFLSALSSLGDHVGFHHESLDEKFLIK